MEKYRKKANELIGADKMHPDRQAQLALNTAEFSTRIMDEFFTDAYGDILVDYFIAWLSTQPHESKARDHLYHCAMALGSVKEKLIQLKTYGRNVPHLDPQEDDSNESGHL